MKRAEISDNYRKALVRNYHFHLDRFELKAERPAVNCDLAFKRGISAIVGRNGVGKSNLIRAMFNCFQNSESNRPKLETPVYSAAARQFWITFKGSSQHFQNEFEHTGEPALLAYMYDPCILVPELQSVIASQENVEELLEQYGRQPLDEGELELLNYVTNGDYSGVEFVEIDEEMGRLHTIPFFFVTHDATTYTSQTMGMGELSIFYLYWLYKNLASRDGCRILFVEEPESFLPPACQNRMAAVFGAISGDLGVQCIVSTHSEHILERLPSENIIVLRKDNTGLRAARKTDSFDHLRTLGLRPPLVAFILLEDDCAKCLAKSLVETSSTYASECFDYDTKAGSGGISKSLDALPANIGPIAVIGLYDGDQRSKEEVLMLGAQGKKICFLPGETSPEEILRSAFDDLGVAGLADLFSRRVEAVESASENARGADPHDFFLEVARSLGVSIDAFREALFIHWIKMEENAGQVAEFVDSLESHLSFA